MYYGSNQPGRARQENFLTDAQRLAAPERNPRYSIRERWQLVVAEELISVGKRLRSAVVSKSQSTCTQIQFR